VRDRVAGTTSRVSLSSTGGQLEGDSENPTISADGRYVGFATRAANAVPGDTNGAEDVFVRDRLLGRTIRASVSTAGAQGDDDSAYPRMSGTGRSVVFGSRATNLVPGDTNESTDVFVRYF
jgi:Tol biopolymer transport system component